VEGDHSLIIASAQFRRHFMVDGSMSLTTERLVVRPACEEDLPFATSVWTDARVRIFLGGAITNEEAARRIWPRIDARELLVISRLDDRTCVGLLGVTYCHERQLELTYLLEPEQWNRGYAKEAIAALIDNLKSSFAAYRLFAITQAENTPSRHLLRRLGFREERKHIELEAPQITYGVEL
jgi:RimJ/RimL family protein N-acetyltransferase